MKSDFVHRTLLAYINRFCTWLKVDPTGYTFHFHNDPAEWLLTVHQRAISINCSILERCELNYFAAVTLHELYHALKQGMPNPCDVKIIRDTYDELGLRTIDIDADTVVSRFYKEVFNYSLDHFYSLLFSGKSAFKDTSIRPGKFNHFLGTMLSVYTLYNYNLQAIIVPHADAFYATQRIAFFIYTNTVEHANLVLPKKALHLAIQAYSSDCTQEEYISFTKRFCYATVTALQKCNHTPFSQFSSCLSY